MQTAEKPDVRAIMREIAEAARRIEAEPPRRRRTRKASVTPSVLALEENWDVWEPLPVTTHRGWKGIPVVLLKRVALLALKPHDRELLKKQREYNWALKTEIQHLRTTVVSLMNDIADLRTAVDDLSQRER